MKNSENQQLLLDLFRAYFDTRKNKRSTANALAFEADYEQKLFSLYRDIMNRTYTVGKSVCFIVEKPVKREIFAADFRDRIVQHLIFNYINPVFEKNFIKDSYSCRIGKDTSYGIKRVNHFIRSVSENYTKECWILKLDIQGYFMAMDRDILYTKIERRILELQNAPFDADLVLYLIRTIIYSDPTKNFIAKGRREDWVGLPKSKSLFFAGNGKGFPIGNLTSQLFSNIYLDEFDHYVHEKLGIPMYGRYVDDMVFVHHDKAFLKSCIARVKTYLNTELKLTLHPKKIYLQNSTNGVAFLGTYIKPWRIYIGTKTKKNFYAMLENWNSFVKSTNGFGDIHIIKKFVSQVNSYLGIMSHYNTYTLRKSIAERFSAHMGTAIVFSKDFKKVGRYIEQKQTTTYAQNIPPQKSRIPVFVATFFVMLVLHVFSPGVAFATTYYSSGEVVSTNLLSGASASAITNFHYTLSSLPGDSSVLAQFSIDNTNWYSAAGTLNGSTTLSTTGGADLALTGGWSGSSFYYKLTINSTSDMTGTPVMDDVRLDYTANAGYGNTFAVTDAGYVGIGTSSPAQLLSVAGNMYLGGALYDMYNTSGTYGKVLQTTSSGVQWVATSSLGVSQAFSNSASLAALLSDETGTAGAAVFSQNPLLEGFRSNASSTIGDGTGAGGLTISGNATTTGDMHVAGMLGVGTIPSYPLHVVGQCVTADTRLRRRRRRKVGETADEEKGEWADADYIYDRPMIKDIRPGDEVQSLDMKTGALVWSMVNGVVYTGIQKLVRITTQSGRQIRTTDVHPYLIRTGKPATPHPEQKLYRFEVDQSIRFDEYGRDTFISVANIESASTVCISHKDKALIRDILKSRFPKEMAPTVFALGIVSAMRALTARVHELVIDTEYHGHEDTISAIIKKSYPTIMIYFTQVGKKSPAHKAAYGAFVGKRESIDVTITPVDTENALQAVLYGHIHSAHLSLQALPVTNSIENKDKSVNEACGETENALRTALYGNESAHHNPQAPLVPTSVRSGEAVVKHGMWVKAESVHIGHEMAVVYGDTVVWERVVNVERLPEESVYDIEIDGTHNFIGNDIVAHNTFLGGGLRATASSTIGDGTGAGGLTIYGNATTTGDAYFGGDISINTGTGDGYIYWNGQKFITASSTAYNTYIGLGAGTSTIADSINGKWNTGVGYMSLQANTIGYQNTALGTYSLKNNISGNENVAIGGNALLFNTTGSKNSAFGSNSLRFNTSGSDNIGIGGNALQTNITGSSNIALGSYALFENLVGSQNIAIGIGALENSTGTGTVAIGYKAGDALTGGDRNIIIGYNNDFANASTSFGLNIGNLIYGIGVDGEGTTLSSGNIGIGTSSPSRKLTVAGDTYISGNVTAASGTITYASTTGLTATNANVANIIATNTTFTNATTSSLAVTGKFYDTTGSAGTDGYILKTTSTGVQWIATSSLGLGDGTFLGLSDTPNSYTSSAIPYVSGSALAFNSNFVFDGTNLGIGTNAPGAMLDIFGASNALRLSFDGSNYAELSVDSTGLLSINSTGAGGAGSGYVLGSGLAEDAFTIYDGNAQDYYLGLDDTDDLLKIGLGSEVGTSTLLSFSSATTTVSNALFATSTSANTALTVSQSGAGDIMNLFGGSTEVLTVLSNGSVGIGSTTPTSKLTIQGTAGNAQNLFTVASSTGSTSLAVLASGDVEVSGNLVTAGINWTARQHASTSSYYSVAYGNGKFVAVGDGAVMSSSDGVNWATSTPAISNNWKSVTYGNGLFVAVSTSGTGNRVMTSLDGITWTSRTSVADNSWYGVTYGNGLFVAVSNDGTGDSVMTSPDGITWTTRNPAVNNYWNSVTYGNGLFVAVAVWSGLSQVMTSHDGVNWTARSAAGIAGWNSVTYGNGLFVVVAPGGSGNRIMTSPDGVNWTSQPVTIFGLSSVTYGNGLFVAVSTSGTGNRVMTSLDGITWTSRTSAADNFWYGITYGNGMFVAVSADGTNRVMTSGKTTVSALAHNNIYQGGMSVLGGAFNIGTTTATTSVYAQNILNIASTTGTSLLTMLQNGNVGIGSSTPTARLTIQGSGTTNPFTVASSSGSSMLTVLASGNVGIGTSTSSAKFAVTGTAGAGNALFAFASSTGANLLSLDARGVLNFGTSTTADIFLNGGATATNPQKNQDNIAIGNNAFLYYPSSGSSANIAIGKSALSGSSTLMMGGGNVAVGSYAGLYNAGQMNVFVGSSAGLWNGTGEYNVFVGMNSGQANRTGDYNAFFGNGSGYSNTTGIKNTFVGHQSSLNNTTGSYNSSFGDNALISNTTGSFNQGFGYRAGFSMTAGTSTTFLGAMTDTILANISTSTALGAGALLARSNTMVLGGTGANSVDIVTGTSTPWAKFSIQNNYGATTPLFDIATTTSSTYATSSLFRVAHDGRVSIGSTTPESSTLTIDKSALTGAVVGGIKEYLAFTNSTESAVYYGDNAYILNTPTATSTLVGSILRIEDNSALGNTVRGIEAQAYRGTNTKGENTGLAGFGRTFGVRGTTLGDAGNVHLPAGIFAESEGTTQGNALRAYSGTLTSETLVSFFQDSSVFTGTGLNMNFGNSGGSFSGTNAKFLDFQIGGTSKFMVTAQGTTTIGDGTTNNMAGLQIGYGGLCVDNDGSCTASTTGRITSVSSASGNSDLAEMYFSSDDLEGGEIVALKGGLSITRAEEGSTILGVVSTKPGVIMGFDDTSLTKGETPHPVALKGRVPVKLSTENGPIEKGDSITLSSIPGVGMKATEHSTIVGIALEDYDGSLAYSPAYINQFGDDLVKAKMQPLNQNIDTRTQDGCSYGGGSAQGEAPCVKDKVSTIKPQTTSIDTKTEALNALKAQTATTTMTPDGKEVTIGQAIMFVHLNTFIPQSERTMLTELLATSTVQNGNGTETLWDRVKTLAQGFVDGVLTLTGIKVDKVETKELCVDGVCVTADDLRALLNKGGEVETVITPPTPSEPEPLPEPTSSELTDPAPASEEGVPSEVSTEESISTPSANSIPEVEAPVSQAPIVESVSEEATPTPAEEQSPEPSIEGL